MNLRTGLIQRAELLDASRAGNNLVWKSPMMRLLKTVSLATLTVLGLVWFGFSLLSVAQDGLRGLIMNLPNALSWLDLLAIVGVALRWEFVGGLLALMAGIAAAAFFNALANPVVLLAVVAPLSLRVLA